MNMKAFTLLLLSLLFKSPPRGVQGEVANPEEVADLFEGDIVIPEEEEQLLEEGEAGAGIIGNHYRWPSAVIPYDFSDEFKKSQVKTIEAAMKEIENKTCIRFTERRTEAAYILFRDGPGCSSQVGRQGNKMQYVTLNIKLGCVQKGTTIHELVHAIGFWHEQSRTDRDDFVTIKTANIPDEKLHNFDKYTSKDINDFGVPYDYDSIMHYPDTAFLSPQAARSRAKTIVPKKAGVSIGQRKYLSKLDALKINRMYCPDPRPTITKITHSKASPSKVSPVKTGLRVETTTPGPSRWSPQQLAGAKVATRWTTSKAPVIRTTTPVTPTTTQKNSMIVKTLVKAWSKSKYMSPWKRKQLQYLKTNSVQDSVSEGQSSAWDKVRGHFPELRESSSGLGWNRNLRMEGPESGEDSDEEAVGVSRSLEQGWRNGWEGEESPAR